MEIEYTLEEIEEAARKFKSVIGEEKVFAFRGEMGAGKTTFINALCRVLGSVDETGSPTFSLVNEYTDAQEAPIYHFDFYRIESPAEALDMGVEEYFFSGNLCFIEWPEKIGTLLPEEAKTVNIYVKPDGKRKLVF